MALFENFPYTNLHDLNLDWVLSTIRKLIAEWAAYQEAMNKNFRDLEEAFISLRQYVMDYFDNLDLDDAVTAAVRAVLEEMIEDGTIEELIAEYIKNIGGGGQVTVNLLAEYLTDTLQNSSNWFSSEHYEFAPQGFCYIGNNQCVIYVRTKPESESKGRLICIDLSSGTVLWKSDRIICYHGNTIAYKDGYLYLSGAVDDSSGTSLAQHSVFKIDPQHPSDIAATYTIPGQNIAIDDVTGKFYVGGGQLGNNVNKVWVYDDEAALASATVSDTPDVTLQSTDLTSYVFNHARCQGIAVHNGTMYCMYDMELSAILAFNVETGQYIRGWNIPYIWNGCKYSQELEDLSYDPVNDRWLIMTITPTQRTHNCQVANIGEIGLYKSVVERLPRYAIYEGSQNTNVVINVRVENDSPDVLEAGACKPFFDRYPVENGTPIPNGCEFYNAYDAELYASMRGNVGYIHYIATARRTGRPVFSNWHPHTDFKLSAASDCKLRITVPDFRRVTSAYITGSGSAGLVNLWNSKNGHILEVTDNTVLTLENVELEPSDDNVVRGIDIYRCGTVRFSQVVKMAEGYESITLYRIQTNGMLNNCVKVYDGPVARGETYNFELPVWSTGLLAIETFINGQDNHAMLIVDREGAKAATGLNGSAALKLMIPVDGDYYIANVNISQTTFRFYALKKASDSSNADGFDRVIIRQYPNVTYFSKQYLS